MIYIFFVCIYYISICDNEIVQLLKYDKDLEWIMVY